jgi:hypothetical protein
MGNFLHTTRASEFEPGRFHPRRSLGAASFSGHGYLCLVSNILRLPFPAIYDVQRTSRIALDAKNAVLKSTIFVSQDGSRSADWLFQGSCSRNIVTLSSVEKTIASAKGFPINPRHAVSFEDSSYDEESRKDGEISD